MHLIRNYRKSVALSLINSIDGELRSIQYDYDADGNRKWVKDQNGNVTTFEYDGLNSNTRIIYPDSSEESYGYDWLGNKTSRTNASGVETDYRYTSRNRLYEVEYEGGRKRNYTYDDVGNLKTVVESENTLANVSYMHDALNRVTNETSCGVTHTYDYDRVGNRTDADYGVTGRHIDWNYDSLNRIQTIIDTQGYTKITSVSGGGANLTNAIVNAISGELLLVENGTYDPVVINKSITVQSVNGAAYASIQTSSGRCASLTNNARLIGFTLTGGNLVDGKGAGALVGNGCLIADCDIDNNTASGVNACGGGLFLKTGATAQNCLIQNNRALNGGGIFCEKGGLVRNCTIESNEAESMGGGGVFMQEGGWMANSIVDDNMATNTFARGGGGVLFYNEGGKVNSSTFSANTSTNNGAAWSHRSTYVDPGKVGEVKHSIFWNNQPAGSSNGWISEGNQTENPSTVSSAPGANLAVSSYESNESRTTTFKYDLNSNLLKRELSNSVDEFRTYDALNRMVANTNKLQSMVFATVDYQYDSVGNLRQMDDTITGLHSIPSSATWNWTYDDSYRLLSETCNSGISPAPSTEYDWDPAGNRTERRKYANGSISETLTYKAVSKLNQMLGWTCGETNAVYTYDANGNRQDQFINVDGTTEATNYEYDDDNRLITVTVRDTEQPKTYSFEYDYRTRRIKRVTPTETSIHVFDGGLSVQEYDGSSTSLTLNNLTTESIRGEGMGGGVGGMVYSIRNGQMEASHSNHRGDVFARTDNAGNITWFARYEAYGKRFHEVGATYDRQRGNTKDEETPLGFINDGMRPRGLEHGVYLTRDPAGFVDGPNLYCYVHCQPVTGFDPLGLWNLWSPATWGIGNGYGESGWNSLNPAGSSANWGAAAEGAKGGATIVADTFTFGSIDSLHESAESLQGAEYTASRIMATVSREATIMAATGGLGKLAQGGNVAAQTAQKGLLIAEAGTGGFQVGQGANKMAEGDIKGGALDMLSGTMRVGGALGNAKSLTQTAYCFPAGTPVSTPRGLIPIEALREDDSIYAFDFTSGKVIERQVLETINSFTHSWVELVVGTETIFVTKAHLFWVESEQEWISAIDLQSGMELLLQNGSSVAIREVTLFELEAPEDTFNLIVDVDHNYFAGDSGVLVHNGKEDVPVFTSNGQRASENGTRIGPSGKSEFHNSNSATRKKAFDGAKSQGAGETVVDKATKKQSKHFHALDRDGKRIDGPKKTHFNKRGDKPRCG